jgi:hypothetical protein
MDKRCNNKLKPLRTDESGHDIYARFCIERCYSECEYLEKTGNNWRCNFRDKGISIWDCKELEKINKKLDNLGKI